MRLRGSAWCLNPESAIPSHDRSRVRFLHRNISAQTAGRIRPIRPGSPAVRSADGALPGYTPGCLPEKEVTHPAPAVQRCGRGRWSNHRCRLAKGTAARRLWQGCGDSCGGRFWQRRAPCQNQTWGRFARHAGRSGWTGWRCMLKQHSPRCPPARADSHTRS